MTTNNVAFNDRKMRKSIFYTTKRLFNMDDIDFNKTLIFKKEPYEKKIHLNTSLNMIIMIISVHYVKCFLK